jgi:hypothetical protein
MQNLAPPIEARIQGRRAKGFISESRIFAVVQILGRYAILDLRISGLLIPICSLRIAGSVIPNPYVGISTASGRRTNPFSVFFICFRPILPLNSGPNLNSGLILNLILIFTAWVSSRLIF